MFNNNNEIRTLRNLTSFSLLVLFVLIFYITTQSDQRKNYNFQESNMHAIQEANIGGAYFMNPMPLINEFTFPDTSAESEKENNYKIQHLKEKLREHKILSPEFNKEIQKEMENLQVKLDSLKFEEFHFEFDSLAFNEQMKELHKHLENLKFDGNFKFDNFHFDFDSSGFKENMEKLKENMQDFKFDGNFKFDNFHFDFDSSGFKEKMETLKENMQDFKFNGKFKFDEFHFDFDSSGFKEKMEELQRHLEELELENNYNLQELQFKLNNQEEKIIQETLQTILDNELINEQVEASLNQLEKEIANLNINLEELKPELESLNKEVEILEMYVQEIKTELINDGLIKNKQEDVNLNFDSGELYLNGEKIPDSLQPKYKAIHDKYFD